MQSSNKNTLYQNKGFVDSSKHPSADDNLQFGIGEMGQLILKRNWDKSTVGNIKNWPQSLVTSLSIILHSRFPMFLFWGPELICFYNDAYRPSLGNEGKHPVALGMPGKEVWPEIWHIIQPMIDQVLAGGEATWSEDQLIPIYRNGKIEDVYWTFSYSAVYDETGNTAGVFVTCTETTNTVITVKNLQEREDQLEFTIHAANLGTWDLNPLTNTFSGNSQLRQWFGLNVDGMIDANLAISRIVEKDRQKTIDAMQAAMKPGSNGIYEVEHTVLNPYDNKERVLLAKGKVQFDDNNSPIRFSGTAQDITEQVLARHEAEEKNLLNNIILESSPDCVKVINPQGKISYMNENGVVILEGKSKKQFIGKDWVDMWGEKEKSLIQDSILKGFKGSSSHFQVPALTAKNTLKWWDVIVSPLTDKIGNVINLLAVSRDITELKTAELKIAQSEEKLRFALEGANIGHFDIYPGTGQINWSAKTREFFGVSEDVIITKEIYEAAIYEEDLKKTNSDLVNALQKNSGGQYVSEYRTSKTNKWLYVKGKVSFDADDVPIRISGVIQDITLQKELDSKLALSINQLRLYEKVVVNIKEAVMITEAEPIDYPGPKMLYVNDAFCKMTGYTSEELIGQSPRIFHGPKTDRKILDSIKTALRNWETVKVELINYTKAGREFYVEFEIVPVANEKGWFTHWVSVQRDVTEKVLAHRKLVNSEKRFQDLIEAAPVGIGLFIGEDLVIENPNQTFLDITGKGNDIAGKTLLEVVPELKDQPLHQILKQVYSTGKEFRTYASPLNLVRNGEWKECFFDFSLTPLLDAEGKVYAILDIGLEVTDQVNHTKKIKESEEQFRMLAETLPQLIWVTDAEGQQQYASVKWNEYTGIKSISTETWQVIVHPEDLDSINKTWQQSLQKGNAYHAEVRLRDKNGNYNWFSVNADPLRNDENSIIKWVGAFTNIHAQKMFAHELELQVKSRTAELSNLNEELYRANNKLLEKNETLAISENFNRSLAEVSPNVIYIYDLQEKKAVYVSNNGLNIIGKRTTNVEAMNNIQQLLIHPEDISSVMSKMSQLRSANDGDIIEHEYRIQDSLGNWIPFFARETVFKRNEEKEVTQLLGIAVDISEIKKVQAQLEASKVDERFRNLTEEAPMWVWMANENIEVTYANTELLNYIGIKDYTEFTGSKWEEMLHPEDVPLVYQKFGEAAINIQPYSFECRVKSHAKKIYEWHYIKGTPRFESGKFEGFIGTGFNIQEQKNIFDKLQESERNFRQLAGLLPDKVNTANASGEIIYINQEWIDSTGISFDVLKQEGWKKVIHPDDIEKVSKLWNDCINSGNDFEMEFRIKNVKGGYDWHLSRATAMKDEEGKIVKWVSASTEIQKIKEEEKRKSDFIKMVSHELKTPVTSIKGYVQLLLSILDPKEMEKISSLPLNSFLTRIDKQVIRLTRLITEMLDLSRLEESKLDLRKEYFSINDMLTETVQDITYSSKTHKINLKHDYACTLYADKDRLQQVVINFINNAIKYSPEKEAIDVRIFRTRNNMVAVSVRDYGIGIQKADQRKIFERFFRVDGNSEQSFSGFGIGLFIAKEIIERHYGAITIQSDLGKGATFTFTLPLDN